MLFINLERGKEIMKAVGIVRSIDGAGRIVLPIEIRKELDLMGDDSRIEILARGNELILKKYAPSCIFCHGEKALIEFGGQKICRECAQKISGI